MDETQDKPGFTPGPWSISGDDGDSPAAMGSCVCVETEGKHVAFCFDDDIATANLIAAAPELYGVADSFAITESDDRIWLWIGGQKIIGVVINEQDQIVQAMRQLEQLRAAALAKAKGGPRG